MNGSRYPRGRGTLEVEGGVEEVTMYNQLLYSAGGGIIGNKHKAEQAECVTLAIGLGGTGINCLRKLTRQV